MHRRVGRSVAGFAVALAVVGAFLWVVGPRAVAASVAGAAPLPVLAGLLAVLGAYYCWSEALRRLLGSVGHTHRGPRYRAAFMAAEFAKQVVPMGHTAGPMFVSYTVSRETDTPYETALAAATVVEFVNVAASILLATGGLALVLLARDGPLDAVFLALIAGLVLAAAALGTAALLVAFRRAFVERLVRRTASLLRGTVGRLSGRVRRAVADERISATVAAYYAAVDRALLDRRRIGRAAAFSLLGWGLFVLPLALAFRALGVPVSYPLVACVVPVLSLVNVVPLPGGLGGFEVALALVLASVVGLSLPVATAGVLIYRLTNYWFVVLLGAAASAVVSTPLTRAAPVLDPTGPDAE